MNFCTTVTPEIIELTGQGGKYVMKHDEIDSIITILQEARDCARIVRQVVAETHAKPTPTGKSHLTLVKS